MSSNATGATDAVRRRFRIGSTRDGGFYQEEFWEGTERAMTALYSILFNAGFAEVLHDHEGPVHSVYFRREDLFPNQPVLQEYVRLYYQSVAKSIFEPPNPVVDENTLRVIRDAIDNPIPGQSPALTDPNAIKLYLLGLRGVRYRNVDQPWLIKSVTTANTFQFDISWANVGAIISIGRILVEANVQGPLRFTLPGDVSTDSEFAYGWLKHAPEYDYAAGSLAVLTQRFEYGLWSTFLYGTPV